MFRMVYPFLAAFGRGMGVELTTLSYAMTLRSLAGALGPFLAYVGDRRGRKIGMLLGLFLFIIGVGLVAIRPSFPTFVLALILSVLGKYTYDPSMQAYLGDRVAYKRRGRVLAVTELSWSLSIIIAVPLMGLLIARYGWSGPFPVLTLLALVAFVVLAWMIPQDKVMITIQSGLWQNFRRIFAYPPVLAGLLMAMFSACANEVINLVFGLWLENSFGLMIAALGVASAVIGLSELGGESLAAAITDRLGKPLAVGLGLGLNCLAVLALPILGANTSGALVGLFFFYLTFEFSLVSSVPMMTEVMPSSRATVMAVTVASISIGRAVGVQIATPLYIFGSSSSRIPDILPNSIAAVSLNLLAIAALSLLVRGIKSRSETPVI